MGQRMKFGRFCWVVAPLLVLPGWSLQAGSATWKTSAQDASWFNTANWTPATIPDGATDVAFFGVTNFSLITGMGATLSQIDFASNASTYQITLDVAIHTIVGPGVTGNGEKFILPHGTGNSNYSELAFTNSASAGSSQYVINGADSDGLIPGVIVFADNSTAGTSIITLNSGNWRGCCFIPTSPARVPRAASISATFISRSIRPRPRVTSRSRAARSR